MYVLNKTDEYDNIAFSKCTNNENNIDIVIPTILPKIPCGLSFYCLRSLMVKLLVNKRKDGNIFIHKSSS